MQIESVKSRSDKYEECYSAYCQKKGWETDVLQDPEFCRNRKTEEKESLCQYCIPVQRRTGHPKTAGSLGTNSINSHRP